MSGNRAIGYGLLAGAAGFAVLVLLWLMTAGVNAGGFTLGLMLLFVVAGPLAGGGWWMLNQQKSEAAVERRFVGKRRILDADRLFRRELAAELRQLARRPGLPGAALTEMAEDLERRSYDSPEWFETVALDDDQVSILRRYDDLVWQRTRALAQLTPVSDEVDQQVRDLQRALDDRKDLLLRGRRAPSLAPVEVLRTEAPGKAADPLGALAVGDAVTLEGDDYLVEGLASAFAEGQQWKLARLAPSGARGTERWLYVGPGLRTLALMDEVRAPEAGVSPLVLSDATLPLASAGSATVDVEGGRDQAQGVLVSYWLYRSGDRLALVQRWPDNQVQALAGSTIRASDLEVWPASVRSATSPTE